VEESAANHPARDLGNEQEIAPRASLGLQHPWDVFSWDERFRREVGGNLHSTKPSDGGIAWIGHFAYGGRGAGHA
jgi:hypothetical protein